MHIKGNVSSNDCKICSGSVSMDVGVQFIDIMSLQAEMIYINLITPKL